MLTDNVFACNHPKFMNGPHVAYGGPKKFMDGPENFSLKITYFFIYKHFSAQIRVHTCSTFKKIKFYM